MGGPFEVWVDAESNLPVLVRWENLQPPAVIRVQNFQWNIELLKLLMPPQGYTDVTPKPPSLEEQIGSITEALKLYAEQNGGHYPQAKTVYIEPQRELPKVIGHEGQPTQDEVAAEKYRTLGPVVMGLNRISLIQTHNPDSAYYGKTVGPNDKDKVLLRWKLDDGQYEVIFGDLCRDRHGGTPPCLGSKLG